MVRHGWQITATGGQTPHWCGTVLAVRRDEVIHIDAAELGPRNAKVGERMTAGYANGFCKLYEFDGKRWVLLATFSPGDYPKCWTLADGTRQADHP